MEASAFVMFLHSCIQIFPLISFHFSLCVATDISLTITAQRTDLCYTLGILQKATLEAVLELGVLRFIFISHLS